MPISKFPFSKFPLALAVSAMSFAAVMPAQAHIVEEETQQRTQQKTESEMRAKQPTARLSVNGQGISFQEPDTAHVNVGVVATGATAEEAMAANGEKMSATIDALLAAGVERKHIQTSGLNLSPVYNHHGRGGQIYNQSGERPELPERKITSYTVQNRVSAKTHQIGQVGAILDAVVRAGSNNIGGVRFSLKDDTLAKEEARKSAMKDARIKAQNMAEGAGIKLGRILLIGEGVNYNHRYTDEIVVTSGGGGGYSTGAVVQSGQQQITAAVHMIYEIIQ